MHYVLFIAISLLWSASFILMKRAALAFGPVGIAAGRDLAGAAALAIIWILRSEGWPFTRRRHWRDLLVIAAIGNVFSFIVQPYLIASTQNSGFIGMMVAFVPLLTILVSIPLIRTWPTRRQFLGVLGGLVCMGVIFQDGLGRAMPWWQLVLALGIPLCYALSNTWVKRAFSGVSPLAVSCMGLLLAGGMLLGPGLTLPGEGITANEHLPLAAGSLAILGVLGTGLATFGFYWLVQKHGPLFAGMVTYLIPVGAVIIGWLDGETVTWLQAAALVGVILMVIIVQYPVRPGRRTATAG